LRGGCSLRKWVSGDPGRESRTDKRIDPSVNMGVVMGRVIEFETGGQESEPLAPTSRRRSQTTAATCHRRPDHRDGTRGCGKHEETTHIPGSNHLAVSDRRAGLGGTQGKAAGRGLSILAGVSGALSIPSNATECVAVGCVKPRWDVDSRLRLTRRPVAPYQFFLRRVSGVPRRRPRHGQRVILSQDTAIDIRVRRTAGGLTILPTVASGSNENT
jgi:hypothetical protein